jgi:alkanesulfonate monooxygenase SsuD/methylene tetrahydromethanopterin reductase-like flavin-dependent oxidoreductase (luciferase family)
VLTWRQLKGLPYAFASHFAPAQLQTAISIYRNNFKPSFQLSEPYVIACINVIAAETDTEANRLATSFKNYFWYYQGKQAAVAASCSVRF